MEGVEKMEDSLDKPYSQKEGPGQETQEPATMEIPFSAESASNTKNILDRVMIQMLIDSKNENDETLRILPQPVFDLTRKIDMLDVKDSTILKIMYLK